MKKESSSAEPEWECPSWQNKHKGVYAAVCENTYAAEKSRAINNANILTMGGWITGEVCGMPDRRYIFEHRVHTEPGRVESK